MTDIERKTEEVLDQEVSKDELDSVAGGYTCTRSEGSDDSKDKGASKKCYFGMRIPKCGVNSIF